jgi:hypothetical protein
VAKSKKSEVWMHRRTGQLYEHLYTCLECWAITCVDLDDPITNKLFTDWNDWAERKLFNFDDTKFYKSKNFINLGEL